MLASDIQTTNPTDGLTVTSFSVLSADATGSPIIVPVEIFSVLIGNDPSAAADFTKLANATGGKNFQAADASQVVMLSNNLLKPPLPLQTQLTPPRQLLLKLTY
ncbi:MAG: hypothetical protein ACKO11_05125 [Cuspidothrix sp.]